MVIIKNEAQIEGIRASSQLAAATLRHLSTFIRPGISTQSLDDLAVNYIAAHRATAAPLHYHGYPKSICTSVNNVVCHGIPSATQILKNGDIINIDTTTVLNGYYGDISATFPVGDISPQASKLIEATRGALTGAINSCQPGQRLNECIGKVIENYVSPFGFSPVRELGGHGVGNEFHEDPFVYHFDYPQDKTILQPGMIFTIEPMINASQNWRISIDKADKWTVRTLDGALSCQFEHTILITPKGAEILSKL